MTEPTDIAEWLIAKIRENGARRTYQDRTVREIREQFGEEWSYRNPNGNWAINKRVLREFQPLRTNSSSGTEAAKAGACTRKRSWTPNASVRNDGRPQRRNAKPPKLPGKQIRLRGNRGKTTSRILFAFGPLAQATPRSTSGDEGSLTGPDQVLAALRRCTIGSGHLIQTEHR
ncbi:hypothetical protein ABH923_002820 [Leifsonia sp. EB41]|uniref:DUF6953 family protein n=1 Tax=Leifsonia sp. EB41 TaxID=3156260 RepID=UPI0035157C82